MIQGMKHLFYEDRLRELGLCRWRREGTEETCEQPSVSKGERQGEGDRLFSRVCGDRTRGNGFKLKEGRIRLEISKKSFTMRVEQVAERCGCPIPGDFQGESG